MKFEYNNIEGKCVKSIQLEQKESKRINETINENSLNNKEMLVISEKLKELLISLRESNEEFDKRRERREREYEIEREVRRKEEIERESRREARDREYEIEREVRRRMDYNRTYNTYNHITYVNVYPNFPQQRPMGVCHSDFLPIDLGNGETANSSFRFI